MSNDLISRSHFDDRVRLAAGPDADEEYSADFLDGIKVVLYMLSTEPAAPQEMTAREYLAAEQRMCFDENIGKRNCMECYLSSMRNPHGINCHDYAREYPNEAVAIVEKWAREHPEERSECRKMNGTAPTVPKKKFCKYLAERSEE